MAKNITKGKKWDPEEVEFLTENYRILGNKLCAHAMARTTDSTISMAKKIGLLKSRPQQRPKVWTREENELLLKNYKNTTQARLAQALKIKVHQVQYRAALYGLCEHFVPSKIELAQFSTSFTPESAYLLGLLWADGSVATERNTVSLSILQTDADEISQLIFNTGDWKSYSVRRGTSKPQTCFYITNQPFYELLLSYGYYGKSWESPNHLLSIIPEHLLGLWFRGYWDGDGHLNVKQNPGYGGYTCFGIATSSYFQDWTFLVNVLSSMGISHSIERRKTRATNGKLQQVSRVQFSGYDAYADFYDFLYWDNLQIGFARKQNVRYGPAFLERKLVRARN